jgi:ankyrin repeat protein
MGQIVVGFDELTPGKVKDAWVKLVPQKSGDPVSGELHLKMHIVSKSAVQKKKAAENPLVKAVMESDLVKVEECLADSSVDVNFVDSTGSSVLHFAASRPQWNEGAVQVLLKLLADPRVDVKVANSDKNTAFHYFCKNFTGPHVLGPFNRFIERGVEVNAFNSFGETPLHQAVFNRSLKNVIGDLLVKAGADPNLASGANETPLHYAVRMGREDVVKFLVGAGAKMDIKNKEGKTAFDVAIDEGHKELDEALVDMKDLVEWLETAGLTEYREALVNNDITMFIIPELSDDILKKILPDANDRARILAEAAKLANPDSEANPELAKRKQKLLKQLAMRKQESVLRASLRESARKRLGTSGKETSPSPSRPALVSKLTAQNLKDATSKTANPTTASDIAWEIDPRDLEFERSLGMGSSGEVFEGKYLGNRVAIKVLKTNNLEEEIEEFKKEFQVLVAIGSPNIIKFFGASLSGKLSMVMEFCSRGSLYDVLNKKDFVFEWDRFFSLTREVVQGVEALHVNNPSVLHRDLKTLNVLVGDDWHARVCDFGLSRFNTGSNLSTLAKCRGTYAYIAPEVYNCEKFTTKSDIYSVGVIIWELVYRILTGKYLRPFGEFKHLQFDFQILIQACKMNLRPTIPTNTPQSLIDLITICWAPERDSRIEAAEVLQRLKTIEAEYKENTATWNALLPTAPAGK